MFDAMKIATASAGSNAEAAARARARAETLWIPSGMAHVSAIAQPESTPRENERLPASDAAARGR